jgi:thiol-disulfide isomerase/thioredoxin
MSKKLKREIIEWSLLIIVFGGLYLTGWHTEVLGTLQRGVIATGLIRPDLEVDHTQQMNYNFRLSTLEGEEVRVADFKGETLFINLWATWCPPCIAEMPDIHDLYLEKGRDVAFLMISLDDDPKKAADFIERKGFEFPVYSASYGLPDILQSSSIPTTYVVSSAGEITVTRKGFAKYDTKEFKAYLDKLASQ